MIETMRTCKALAHRAACRSIKTVDLEARPIHHRLDPRVRAHILGDIPG